MLEIYKNKNLSIGKNSKWLKLSYLRELYFPWYSSSEHAVILVEDSRTKCPLQDGASTPPHCMVNLPPPPDEALSPPLDGVPAGCKWAITLHANFEPMRYTATAYLVETGRRWRWDPSSRPCRRWVDAVCPGKPVAPPSPPGSQTCGREVAAAPRRTRSPLC